MLAGCSATPVAQLVPRSASPAAHRDSLPSSLPAHPRLMASDQDLDRVRKLISTDKVARQWSERVLAEARRVESLPPVFYDGPKGIEVARDLQRRVTHLAIAYRLTGEPGYLEAARRELLAAAAFADWSQPSFLATAEMTASVAIGYDWLFNELSPSDREQIRRAIEEKGLRAALSAYQSRAFWVEAHHNWNLVCNGAMIVGALAVMDDQPSLARDVFAAARSSIDNGLAGFEPDGGWEEGPTYWNYGTRYLAYAVASMRSATGSMQGIDRFPGVARTGEFRMHVIGPTEKNFNFADATEAPGDSPQMFAMAWAFKRPEYAAFERDRSHTDPSAFDLLWYQPESAAATAVPTGAMFRGIDLAAFRGAWNDPNTTWVALKGGNNRAHHGHLDLGTFVLDALGQRWAIDLGSDSYDLPGRQRWSYYRYATVGHNTITLDQANQAESAVAPMIAYASTPARSHAAIDLTEAYRTNAKRLLRGVALLNGRDVLVQDEIRLRKSELVAWSMHTRAAVEIHDGRTAILRQGGKTMTARLLYPPGASFSVEKATAPPPQNSNEGVSRLMVGFRAVEPTHIAVLFTPGDGQPDIPRLQPVSLWRDTAGLSPVGGKK